MNPPDIVKIGFNKDFENFQTILLNNMQRLKYFASCWFRVDSSSASSLALWKVVVKWRLDLQNVFQSFSC